MFGMKKSEKMSYGIVGLGRFGSALTEELARSGAELLVIDKDEEKVREVRELTENALVVSNLDKRTLMETGIQNCDVAIVLYWRTYGVFHTYNIKLSFSWNSRSNFQSYKSEHGEILARLGAKVVYPERDMAIRLANRLETSRVLDFIQLSQKINISKLRIPKRCIGKTVSSIDIRARFDLNIIAIESNNNVIENVKPDYVFKEEDILIVSGSRDGVIRFTEWGEKVQK